MVKEWRVDNSRKLYERAIQVIPGGASSNTRVYPFYRPHPIFIDHGKGSKVYDVDGNEYIDYNLCFGANILGHCHPKVNDAVRQQLENGTMFSTPYELEVKVAEKLRKIVPNAEMVRFCQSGTEATMHAIRLARAYTRKDKIIKFEGHYHGHHDYVSVSYFPSPSKWGSRENPRAVPIGPGIPKGTLKNIVVLPWNDPEILEKTVYHLGSEIAAIITEPIMGNAGLIWPEEGYLETMRELTTENNVVLIFDEVITGFRLALGGAQEYFGIKADLATFSKALGGGCPMSAYCGKKEIMENIRPILPALGIAGRPHGVFHGGTYNANPMSLAGTYATLQELSSEGGKVYKTLFRRGERLTEGLREAGERAGHNVLIPKFAGFLVMYLTKTKNPKLKEWRQVRENTDERKYEKFAWELYKRGVYVFPSVLDRWHLSMVHSDEDVEKTIDSTEKAFKVLKPFYLYYM